MGKIITVASYNLHGTQDNDFERFPQIAQLIMDAGVDICGFQEVVNGENIEDTSYQIARILKGSTGKEWYTFWQYCHPFYNLYPEGISILSSAPIEEIYISDLSPIAGGARPLMQRYALIATITINGVRVRFATTHLDHHKASSVRTYQAKQLITDFFKNCPIPVDACFITGDMNATEKSAPLKVFKRNGFTDSYRRINKTGGETFPAASPAARIDYILSKGGTVKDSYTLPDRKELSDHIGIVTKIEVNSL